MSGFDRALPPSDRQDEPEPMPRETAEERVKRICVEKGWTMTHLRSGYASACGVGELVHKNPRMVTCPKCRRLAGLPEVGPSREPGSEG